jgi:hypothetical protein
VPTNLPRDTVEADDVDETVFFVEEQAEKIIVRAKIAKDV